MNTKTILMAMTCLCAFNSLQGNAQVAGGNTLVATAIEQRRVTLRDSILNHISGAKIAEKSLQIKNFGARNDGKTDCRAAFAKATSTNVGSGVSGNFGLTWEHSYTRPGNVVP